MARAQCRRACLPVAAAACAVSLAAATSLAADWPTFRGDNSRSGAATGGLSPPLAAAWVHRAPHPPRPAWADAPAPADYWHKLHGLEHSSVHDFAFHVAVADGRLFYGSSADDAVRCLDAATGRELWAFVTEGPVRLAPAVAGGAVYVGSDDGRLYCLDAATGRERWRALVGPRDERLPGNGRMISRWPVRCGIAVDDGIVYCAGGVFPTEGAWLCAFDAGSGEARWRAKIDICPQGPMALSSDRIVVPTGRTAPALFDRRNGRKLGTLGKVGSTLSLAPGDMIAHGPSENGRIHVCDPAKGAAIAELPGCRLVASGDMLYVLDREGVRAIARAEFIELGKQITALSRKRKRSPDEERRLKDLKARRDACLRWKAPVKARYSLVHAGDTLVAGGDGAVTMLRADTGRVAWTGRVEGKAYGLAVAAGRLYVSTDRGAIHCFGARAGGAATRTRPRADPKRRLPEPNRTVAGATDLALEATRARGGYCIIISDATSLVAARMAARIAERTNLRVIVAAADDARAAARRSMLAAAGLNGTKVAVHGTGLDAGRRSLPYPSGCAALVVYAGLLRGSVPATPPAEIARLVRPYGGALVIPVGEGVLDRDALETWAGGSLPGLETRTRDGVRAAVWRRGAPEGAGEWTHGLADAGNTACSGDTLVGGELEVRWFGSPGAGPMPDRHHRNVPPLFRDGRVFVPADNTCYALDAYSGAELWRAEVERSRRLGAFLDSSNVAVDERYLYVAAGDRLHRFDVETGRAATPLRMPSGGRGGAREWGHVAWLGDVVIGSARRTGAAWVEQSRKVDAALWNLGMQLVTSEFVFALDRRTGRRRWVYGPALVANTTITAAGGRVFFVESTSPEARSDTKGRMPLKKIFKGGEQRLVALDAATGRVLYRKELDVAQFQELIYLSCSNGTLLLSGSRADGKHMAYAFRAFDAADGSPRWSGGHGTRLPARGEHGEQNRHPTIIGDVAYIWPHAYKLATGEKVEGWRRPEEANDRHAAGMLDQHHPGGRARPDTRGELGLHVRLHAAGLDGPRAEGAA
ncbi:MAG: outer membrane protein assembly factor BamB family protein [Planctomycetota bacterium]|jgi:outer membrane protein assembly factor BamB